jgi:antitoxin ParD1/3/4
MIDIAIQRLVHFKDKLRHAENLHLGWSVAGKGGGWNEQGFSTSLVAGAVFPYSAIMNSRLQTMKPLSIMIPEDLDDALRAKIEEGRFSSSSEIVEVALRRWLDDEDDYEQRMDSIRARVKASLDDPRPDLSSEEVGAWIERLASESH